MKTIIEKVLFTKQEMDFWYSNIIPNSGIQFTIEKLYDTILFKNIATNKISPSKLNFFVFKWETIWGFPNTTYTHSDEFIELLINLQTKNFYFIADYTPEAHIRTNDLSLSFLNNLKSNGIDINRLILANNNSAKVGLHRVKYGNFTLNTCFFPYFYLHTYDALKNDIGNVKMNNNATPDKKFLCLNRRMYNHKYQIIEELFNRELLSDTRFSWVDNKSTSNFLNEKLVKFLKIDVNNFKAIHIKTNQT